MKYIIILIIKSVFFCFNVFVFQLHDQTVANNKSDPPYGLLTDDYVVGNEFLNYESEECPDEFVNGLFADPDENDLDETARIWFSDSSLPVLQKRSYSTYAPYGSDTDAEGVSARVNTSLTFFFRHK